MNKKHVIYIFIFCFSSLSSIALKTITYDSTLVKTITASKAQEEKIFNQVDLDFAKKAEDQDIGLITRFWHWLTHFIFGNSSRENISTLQNLIMWVFIIVGVIVIIWILTRTDFTSFLRGNTKDTTFDFSDLQEDITGIDFNDRVHKATAEADYRLAIRWLYLKQLFLLNQKNIITWQSYKTNIDYTNELSKFKHLKSFMAISRIYDYVWYGKYIISHADFQSLENQFKKFEQEINV